MKNHYFAILTPFYNVEKYIHSCINSILNQNYTNWIWFVTDDGSSDGTKEILLDYCSKTDKLIYVDQEHKMEILKNPNKFIDFQFDYFINMDSDDCASPKALEIYNQVLNDYKDDNIVFLSCEASWLFNGQRCYPSLLYLDLENGINDLRSKRGCNIWGCLRCFKNIPDLNLIINEMSGHEKEAFHVEDFVFYIQYQKYGNFLNIKRNLYDFTRREDSISCYSEKKEIFKKKILHKLEEFKKSNKLIAKPLRYWEGDLFNDCNSLLMSGFNFLNKASYVNLFTSAQGKDFSDLFRLYKDQDMQINSFRNNMDYIVINAIELSEHYLRELLSQIKAINYFELILFFDARLNNFNFFFDDCFSILGKEQAAHSLHGEYCYLIFRN